MTTKHTPTDENGFPRQDVENEQAKAPKHTPTPYQLHDRDSFVAIYHEGIEQDIAQLCFEQGDYTDLTREDVRANAAFIVRACNAHAGLVAALENCTKLIEAFEEAERHQSSKALLGTVLKTNAIALAKAKGDA